MPEKKRTSMERSTPKIAPIQVRTMAKDGYDNLNVVSEKKITTKLQVALILLNKHSSHYELCITYVMSYVLCITRELCITLPRRQRINTCAWSRKPTFKLCFCK